MSAQNFIGRQVKITTATRTLFGTVSAIEGGLLYLRDVQCNQISIGALMVQPHEIKDLQVLPQSTPTPPIAPSPAASSSAAPSPTPQDAKPKPKPKKNRTKTTNKDDVREEFDFQGNLARFNKQKVFEEIRQTDDVDQSQRLVSHNRAAKNFANNETVLERDGSRTASAAPQIDELLSQYGPVPLASPLQLVQLEQQLLRTGRSAEALLELSARGISEVAMRALGVSRFDVKNHNSMPLVLVFAGSNRSGLRALAAGRFLATRRVQVVAFTVGKRGQLWNNQLQAFKSAGGVVVSTRSALERIVESAQAPPELLIDGLQGFEAKLADLYNEDDLEVARWLIGWSNAQRAPALAVDVPSGEPVAICANWIACCGYPVQAVATTTAKKFVIDLGVASEALSAAGMRRFEKVWFGASTVMSVETP